jgi:hypothetical protein
MKHTPFGYKIENGKAVIDEEKADQIRKICIGYLSGMSLENAAKEAGLKMSHSSVRRMITNKKYLGTSYYPQLLDDTMYQRVIDENKRRYEYYGKATVKEITKECRIPFEFVLGEETEHFEDPLKQAEYQYSLIKEKEGKNA